MTRREKIFTNDNYGIIKGQSPQKKKWKKTDKYKDTNIYKKV